MRLGRLSIVLMLLLTSACVSAETRAMQTALAATETIASWTETPSATATSTATFTPSSTPTITPSPIPTLLGNSGRIIYSAFVNANLENTTGILIFDLGTGVSTQIAPPGNTLRLINSPMSP